MSEPDKDPLAAGVGTWRGIVSRDYSLYSHQNELMLLNIAEPKGKKKKKKKESCQTLISLGRLISAKSADLKASPHQLMAQLIPV